MNIWISLGIFVGVMIISAVLNIITNNGLKLIGMLLLVLFFLGGVILTTISLVQHLMGFSPMMDSMIIPQPLFFYISLGVLGFGGGIIVTMGTPPTV